MRPVRGSRISLARSWGLPGARTPARRAGWVVGLAQIPLRPLVNLLTDVDIRGRENLPAEGGFLACGNHLGPFDALAYAYLMQTSGIAPRFLVKDSLLRVPVLAAMLRSTQQIPVHRGTARSGEALASARAALARGEGIMVFPEGTFSRDPEQWPMRGRLGAARLALATGVPLIPIACWGSHRLLPDGAWLPRPRPRLTLWIGEPMEVDRHENETERDAEVRITDQLMRTITRMLAQIRGEEPPVTLHDPDADPYRPEAGIPVPRDVLRVQRAEARRRDAERRAAEGRVRAQDGRDREDGNPSRPWRHQEGPWHAGRVLERRRRGRSAKEDS